MLETVTLALTTFFATIGPIDVAAMFAGLTSRMSHEKRVSIAVRGTLIATVILLLFALAGNWFLRIFGISLPALRTAGGILLLLIGIEMVSAKSSGATSTTEAEANEARHKDDLAVFPIATPLIAGPGAMGASILLMAEASGDLLKQSLVVICLILILGLTFISMLLASRIQKYLGVTGMHVITRIFGVLLTALAVQFIFDGITKAFFA